MMKKSSLRPANGYQIETAVEMLKANIHRIPNIIIWAEMMGYSRSYFSRKIKEYYGQTPSQLLRDVRIKIIHKKILSHPRKTSYGIARLVGLPNDDLLYKFLSYHFDTNFTELQKKLLNCKDDSEVSDYRRSADNRPQSR